MDRSTVIDEVEGQLRNMLKKNKKSADEFRYWKAQLRDGIHGRDTKEYIMKQLRSAADKLGINVPDYNSDKFKSFINSRN